MVDIEYLKEQKIVIIEHHNKVYGIETPLFKAEEDMIDNIDNQIRQIKAMRMKVEGEST